MPSNHDADARSGGAPRIPGLVWAVLIALGLAGWLAGLRDPAYAWRALLVNFIFFTPLSAAMVAWPAIVMLSRGRWMGPVQQYGLSAIAVAPLSILAFVALWLGRSYWAAWLNFTNLPNQAWLNGPFLFARDGVALAVWWIVALWFALRAREGRPMVLAGWVAFLYGTVFLLLAFDMVMALDPVWFSTLFGGYFFITGLYAAIAMLAFVAACRPASDPKRLHDLGKLVLTFSIMSTYLMFSQLLPIWFESLSHETRFVVPRMSVGPWPAVSVALLAMVYLGPLVLLLTVRAKRTPWRLGAVSLLALVGLWIERWWLVAPTLGQGVRLGLSDVSMCAAFVGALGWGISRSSRWQSAERREAGGDE